MDINVQCQGEIDGARCTNPCCKIVTDSTTGDVWELCPACAAIMSRQYGFHEVELQQTLQGLVTNGHMDRWAAQTWCLAKGMSGAKPEGNIIPQATEFAKRMWAEVDDGLPLDAEIGQRMKAYHLVVISQCHQIAIGLK